MSLSNNVVLLLSCCTFIVDGFCWTSCGFCLLLHSTRRILLHLHQLCITSDTHYLSCWTTESTEQCGIDYSNYILFQQNSNFSWSNLFQDTNDLIPAVAWGSCCTNHTHISHSMLRFVNKPIHPIKFWCCKCPHCKSNVNFDNLEHTLRQTVINYTPYSVGFI